MKRSAMKYFLAGLLAVLFISQAFVIGNNRSLETYPYTILAEYEGFEIRSYAEANFSKVELEGDTYENYASEGFRILAGYIFGDNESGQEIAMTTLGIGIADIGRL